ncbi:hypothetical protein [Neisseria sp. Ec49-e6-T10]|uniref:hypothetical protein n=1 Tax=Neisseria sp. Ec49-e6-T10 TaxID=3140744 RepID=UPI003EB951F2
MNKLNKHIVHFYLLGLFTLLSASTLLAECFIPTGHYRLHPLAQKHHAAKSYQEVLRLLDDDAQDNHLVVLKKGNKLYLQVNTDKTITLTPLSKNNQAGLTYIQEDLLLPPTTQASNRPVCGVQISTTSDDMLMLVKLDTSQASTLSDEQKNEIRRIFPADFSTETPTPKIWTTEELSQFQYFLVWRFSIPTVTGGIIFVPLEKFK